MENVDRKRILLLIFFVLLLGGLIFGEDIFDFYSKISLRLPQVEKGFIEIIKKETERKVSLPPPLRSEGEAAEAFLTRSGVISWTNIQREKYGLPHLKENKTLNAMAAEKVRDMFENQYFSHDSPSGIGVADLARTFGYQFIAIGENLALGNFENDEALLGGWMDSPGHRENILNSLYQEIGVAVAKGIFEGKSTWLAVQHFGLPLAACPLPDETIKIEIGANQAQTEELEQILNQLQIEIKTMRPRRDPDFSEKIEEYNSLVLSHNDLIEETKELINEYNSQVQAFNLCAAGTD